MNYYNYYLTILMSLRYHVVITFEKSRLFKGEEKFSLYASGGESSKGIPNVHFGVFKKEENDLSSIDSAAICGREWKEIYGKDGHCCT